MLPPFAPSDVRRRVLAILRSRVREGGLSHKKAADLACCSQPQLSNIVIGNRQLGESQAESLMQEMQLTASDLYTSEERDDLRHWLNGETPAATPKRPPASRGLLITMERQPRAMRRARREEDDAA